MKLLTPQETKDSTAKEVSLNISRAQETRKVLAESQKQLREVEATFDLTIARQREQFSLMQREEMEKIGGLKKEVSELESRKRELLLPIDEINKKAENMLKEAVKALEEAANKREACDDLQAILEEKIDEVSEEKQIALSRNREIESRMNGLKNQEEMTRIGTSKLSESLKDFIKEKEDKESELSERKIELDKYSYTLESKSEQLKVKEEDLIQREIKLKDDKGVLERNWERLNKNNV